MQSDKDSIKPIKLNEPDNRQLLLVISQVKEHVVQIEAMVAYLLVCVVALNILDAVVANTRYNFLSWLVPCLFLIGLRLIVRVTNPESRTREGISWASGLGGLGGAAAPAAAGAIFGASAAPDGTLIGIASGVLLGL